EDQPHLALEGGIPGLLGAAVRPARTRLTSHPVPATRKGGSPARSEPGARPEHIGRHRHPPEIREPDKTAENWHNTISNQPRPPAESSRPAPGDSGPRWLRRETAGTVFPAKARFCA